MARALEPLGASHRRACVYHCQQSAEKAIKGYLTQYQKRFPKTHNIAELVDIISLVEPIIARKLHGAKRLTKYAIEYRYRPTALDNKHHFFRGGFRSIDLHPLNA